MNIYQEGGVRTEARLAVANLIKDFASDGKRVYLGLPHEKWEDFKVVRNTCPNVYAGIGIEKELSTYKIAAENCPSWCRVKYGNVQTYLHSKGDGLKEVSCGWMDTMAKANDSSFTWMCERLPDALDKRFKTIPMAFSWFTGREFNTEEFEDSCRAINGVGWQFSTREQRQAARCLWILDLLNESDVWKYEPFEVRPLRKASSMKLMLGVFKRI